MEMFPKEREEMYGMSLRTVGASTAHGRMKYAIEVCTLDRAKIILLLFLYIGGYSTVGTNFINFADI